MKMGTREREIERQREREISHSWFYSSCSCNYPPGLAQGPTWELGTQSSFLVWVAGIHLPVPLSMPSRKHISKQVESEAEMGIELRPLIWKVLS